MRKRGRTPRSCLCCGITFLARLDHIAEGKGLYCSPSCSYQRFPTRVKGSSKERVKRWRIRLKKEVLSHYGGPKCVCCGETGIEFLTFDHIAQDGNAHRKVIGQKGRRIYLWLKENNYPPGFQILCYNCNIARHWNNGICPHQNGS